MQGGAILALALMLAAGLGAWPAQADMPNAAPAASAAPRAASRQASHETGPTAAASGSAQALPTAWYRWGERLLALGVGGGVGWLLLRLGRDGSGSRMDASDRR